MIYRDLDPNLAGIYIFKNKVNSKCYIGQAVSLRKRLKQHLKNLKSMKYDLPLYRALNKYGIHNFDIDILYSFTPTTSNEDTIKILDKIEVKFIEQYNSYTDGYNCTIGGDYGVLGLKMTGLQKKKISDSSRKAVAEGKVGKRVYMYNFIEKYYIYAWTISDAENITKVSRSNISSLCNGRYRTIYCSNFIAAFSKEELEERKKELPRLV